MAILMMITVILIMTNGVDYDLVDGAVCIIWFSSGFASQNSNIQPTLNINSTGEKYIVHGTYFKGAVASLKPTTGVTWIYRVNPVLFFYMAGLYASLAPSQSSYYDYNDYTDYSDGD